METKTKIDEYKGHEYLAVQGVGQQGKEYTIMSGGAAKWARVLEHIKEIKEFVKSHPAPAPATADKSKAKKVFRF